MRTNCVQVNYWSFKQSCTSYIKLTFKNKDQSFIIQMQAAFLFWRSLPEKSKRYYYSLKEHTRLGYLRLLNVRCFVGIGSIRINVLTGAGKWCLEIAVGLMKPQKGDFGDSITLGRRPICHYNIECAYNICWVLASCHKYHAWRWQRYSIEYISEHNVMLLP